MRLALFVALLGVFLAPLAARADLWVDVRRPLSLAPESIEQLPSVGCELVYHGSTKETVRCSNDDGKMFGRMFTNVMTFNTNWPYPRGMAYNYDTRTEHRKGVCGTSFYHPVGTGGWKAETKGSVNCVQLWNNENTLVIYVK